MTPLDQLSAQREQLRTKLDTKVERPTFVCRELLTRRDNNARFCKEEDIFTKLAKLQSSQNMRFINGHELIALDMIHVSTVANEVHSIVGMLPGVDFTKDYTEYSAVDNMKLFSIVVVDACIANIPGFEGGQMSRHRVPKIILHEYGIKKITEWGIYLQRLADEKEYNRLSDQIKTEIEKHGAADTLAQQIEENKRRDDEISLLRKGLWVTIVIAICTAGGWAYDHATHPTPSAQLKKD